MSLFSKRTGDTHQDKERGTIKNKWDEGRKKFEFLEKDLEI
jgi:hypothetical protein